MINQVAPAVAHPIEKFLPLLKNVRSLQNGRGSVACCPAHADTHPSLGIWEDGPDRVGLCCYAGCSQEAILQALGFSWEDLYRDRQKKPAATFGISMWDLAQEKLIHPNLFLKLGMTDITYGGRQAVRIPYYTEDGQEHSQVRIRKTLTAKQGSLWQGQGPLLPYGLQKLTEARAAGQLVIVEGESDCWTLWQRSIPALGLPGAGNVSTLKLSHLDGIERVYISQESDAAGRKFPGEVYTHLLSQGYKGKAYVLDWAELGVNDVNDLYKKDPKGFKATFEQTLLRAPLLREDGTTVRTLSPVFDDLPSVLRQALSDGSREAIYAHIADYNTLARPMQRKFDLAAKDYLAHFPLREFHAFAAEARLGAAQKKKDVEAQRVSDLMKKELPQPRWIIQDVLPEGLTGYVGAPKIGKSWLMDEICLSIVTGQKLFGQLEVEQGEALYLALEDNERGLQSRIKKILADRSENLDGFYYFTDGQFPRLDEYGIAKLEKFIHDHQKLKAIIIDPWVKVKPAAKSRGNVYETDYESLEEVKRLANEYGIAIVVIFHNNKGEHPDILQEINGSTGNTGSFDSIYNLKRGRQETQGVLYGTGRNITDVELALAFDEGIWSLLGKGAAFALGKEREEILTLLADYAEGLEPVEIAELLGKDRNNIRQLLLKMRHDGLLTKIGKNYHPVDNSDHTDNSNNKDNSDNRPIPNAAKGESVITTPPLLSPVTTTDNRPITDLKPPVETPQSEKEPSVIAVTAVIAEAETWRRRIQAYGEARGFPAAKLSDGTVIPAGEVAWRGFLKWQDQKWERAYLDICEKRITGVTKA